MNKRNLIIAIAFFLAHTFASACKIVGVEHEILFRPGTAQLRADDVRKFADWFIKMRDVIQIDAIDIYADVAKKGAPTVRLVDERMGNIQGLIRTLAGPAVLAVRTHKNTINAEKAIVPVDLVAVVAQPACYAAGTCCAGEAR